MRRQIKSLLRQSGLYPAARAMYRSLNPTHRRAVRSNRLFYSTMINAGDLCFDVGANVGQSVEALLAVGAKVIAIEPNPNCLPALQYQFRDKLNVSIVSKAVGASPGFADLHYHGTDSTASMRKDWPFPNDQTMRVDVTTLDALIVEFGPPKFLKVDVEGFELEVFKGLTQPVPLIYFEMHGDEVQVVTDIFERLSSIGNIIGVRAISGDNSRWLIDTSVSCGQFFDRLGTPPPKLANVVVTMSQ